MNSDEMIEMIKQNYGSMAPFICYPCKILRGTKELSVEELRDVIDELKGYANESNTPIITACASPNGCNDIGKMQQVVSQL